MVFVCSPQTCDIKYGFVQYYPTLAGNVTYLAMFIVLLVIQVGFGVRYRTWGFLVGVFGGLVLEILGYIGRVMLHNNPFIFNSFLLYLICLTIGPALISASIYLSLARVVIAYGQSLSRFRPRNYTIIFMSCDFTSLVLQAVGGALAATSFQDNPGLTNMGVHIMVSGLAFQVFSLALFLATCAEFMWKVKKNPLKVDPQFLELRSSFMFKGFLFALPVSTVTIFIRCIFRVAELQAGFSGPLANNETLFMILEGPMIIIAVLALTVFHPGLAFAGNWAAVSQSSDSKVTKTTESEIHTPLEDWR